MKLTWIKKLYVIIFFALTCSLEAQQGINWCEQLYISDITLPPEPEGYMINFKKRLVNRIGPLLSNYCLSECSFIERDPRIDQLIEREARYIDQRTLREIPGYNDTFIEGIRWRLSGRITKTSRFNYTLLLKATEIATRQSFFQFNFDMTFTFPLKYEEILASFEEEFLMAIGQLIQVKGSTDLPNLSSENFNITPSTWRNRVHVEPGTQSFHFYISRCHIDQSPLSVQISNQNYYGDKDSTLRHLNYRVKELNLGRISVSTTRGSMHRIYWKGMKPENNDFEVSQVYADNHQLFSKAKYIQFERQQDSLLMSLPSGIPMGLDEFTLILKSTNHRRFNRLIQVDKSQPLINAGKVHFKKLTLTKFLPAGHLFERQKNGWGYGLLLAQLTTISGFVLNETKSNDYSNRAFLATDLSRQLLYEGESEKYKNRADVLGIGSLLIYAFNLAYGFFIQPAIHKTQRYSEVIQLQGSTQNIGISINL